MALVCPVRNKDNNSSCIFLDGIGRMAYPIKSSFL